MLSRGLRDCSVKRRMEQVVASHITDEDTDEACRMPSGYYVAAAILLSLNFIFLGYLSRSKNTTHTSDYSNNKT